MVHNAHLTLTDWSMVTGTCEQAIADQMPSPGLSYDIQLSTKAVQFIHAAETHQLLNWSNDVP